MTYSELLKYCEQNAQTIHVKYFLEGKWVNAPIAELPFSYVMKLINGWNNKEFIPDRLREIPSSHS